MSSNKRGVSLQIILILLWLAFTTSFALWWFRFSLDHVSLLADLQPDRSAHWLRIHRMIMWEGSTWFVLLILAGAALIVLVQKERVRARRLREFFASFSHEVKTSLASLRLQVEALIDDWSGPPPPTLSRLLGDSVRLQLQLENSLFLASQDSLKLYMHPVSLKNTIDRVREQWPQIQVDIDRDATVNADERALRSVLSNLFQNSLVHGKATAIGIKIENAGFESVQIHVKDNGVGFKGDGQKLGELFHRPTPSSGSGLGLFICKLLLNRMDGKLEVPLSDSGFHAIVELRNGAKA